MPDHNCSLTICHSNIGVQLRRLTTKGPHTLLQTSSIVFLKEHLELSSADLKFTKQAQRNQLRHEVSE